MNRSGDTTAQGPGYEELFAAFWRGLGHPIRLRVLKELASAGPLNVSQLVERLGIGQGHLSNHLACLRSCGFVRTVPQGRYVYYTLSDPRVRALLDLGSGLFADHAAGVAACAVVRGPAAARSPLAFTLEGPEAPNPQPR
ncbi:Transcriptional regulator [Candidatus Hydrogenisulfobacillus filiaventi]|uniref:Transcriptional regulator n=1 Tax=Candidatus Hydrogenisulfobacillus filiaventi TaxID=2707344 RepID=A0A6F8ZD81_9FIRM|nr:metalloregulator ArsR/SmtB family transcription factor [Bacillota bacterium]CAB1127644.1 Transcriptional regulator [Candidatus Hydrogenisulfobacillus filiaventi]